MTSADKHNPAPEWASIIVDELIRAGLAAVVIAPGSRSTPLTLAFAAQGRIPVYSLLDERGAAFFALGIALESGRPAAVLCTSGTAAANFYPAVIEASQSHVPLVVLTADRPPELRGTGANQTIDQVGMYGAYVRLALDLLPPDGNAPPLQQRYLRTGVDRALAASKAPVPGPVHLNIPFRKPLEPVPGQALNSLGAGREGPFTRIEASRQLVSLPDVVWPARGLIVAGPRCPGGGFPQALAALSRTTGYPIVADGLSGLRFGPWTQTTEIFNPQIARAFAGGALPGPDLVLQFGSVPTSNPLLEFLAGLSLETPRISVQPHGTWHDDTHLISHLVHTDPEEFCRVLALQPELPGKDPVWLAQVREAEAAYWAAVESAAREGEFEGLVLQDVLAGLPDNSLLFVSNSMPVRHLDEFCRPSEKKIRVFCNRGASGIDGTISTALGVSAGSDQPTALVLGDLAFYHDLNGLLALHRCGTRAAIIVLHNDGGGIFRRLPVAAFEPPFKELFLTPHGLDFEPAARMFGAEYSRPENRPAFRGALAEALESRSGHIIEFRTDSALHETMRRSITSEMIQHLKKPAAGQSPAPEERS